MYVLLPASLTKIRSKVKAITWWHVFFFFFFFFFFFCFSIISQWEFSVAMATTVLIEPAPKLKSSFSPIPLMIDIKFNINWPTDLGDSIEVCWQFNSPSWARTSELTDPIRPEFELVRGFMPVLVTSKFDEYQIKNERASLETPFSPF